MQCTRSECCGTLRVIDDKTKKLFLYPIIMCDKCLSVFDTNVGTVKNINDLTLVYSKLVSELMSLGFFKFNMPIAPRISGFPEVEEFLAARRAGD